MHGAVPGIEWNAVCLAAAALPRTNSPISLRRLNAVPESYHVRLEKERLVFSAAHFITYNGDECERLHGHNYHVAAELHGPLDENQYVVDFIAVRDALQAIVDQLDHRVLLPTEHPTILVQTNAPAVDASNGNQTAAEIVATHHNRRWVFPAEDCVLLPIGNTTAELLARHIGQQLLASLAELSLPLPERLVISVDECDGQWGVWQSNPSGPAS